ncbi:hypothetical protein PY650_24455 [Rhizobium calliandrae]|uniref:DNA-binding protein n=1 Tax=Rhizobium calliandrae TaxID=1312182 RepID=A0ABT7KJA8_9HYPH|nr:hypothetical protein [Rhizobium calliandrae]MDL2408736.1 hypothetical protein [Rhizobium calliandrae]
MSERVPPIFIRPAERIGIREACQHTGKTDRTIRTWCKRFGIGRVPMSGGALVISLPALNMVMQDDPEALELLRAGDRTNPLVRRHFTETGTAES